ncbi:MAG: phosphomevalonate kinase [Cirrosporium novae-zelandiae]|nr:MAG: phosphomevalonate kinase [Cirrosporium novae-zelandiae]
MASKKPYAVSTPGKVLLAGGYLILDRKHTGLVFALNARMHVIIKEQENSPSSATPQITVLSPQFVGAEWQYNVDGVVAVPFSHAASTARNPFVETTITYTLAYLQTHNISIGSTPIQITILADDGYYTQSQSTKPYGGRFSSFNVPLLSAHKTGLGSSAALVTALTAALLGFFHSLSVQTHKLEIHNLAQAAHCAAQGKVGSGFDVASAVYGSCLYRRFTPSRLAGIPQPSSPTFPSALQHIVEGADASIRLDAEISENAVIIPKHIKLLMCDVDCGSKTPGMVKKVLEWRAKNPEESDAHWSRIQESIDAISQDLTKLAHQEESNPNTDNNSSTDLLAHLQTTISQTRTHIRQMSEKSHVPIEPPSQTALLDACSAIPGVIGGVVPGAGGFDAIALLVEDKEDVVAGLRELADGWRDPEGVIGRVRVLDVRQEQEGLVVEEVGGYGGWLE